METTDLLRRHLLLLLNDYKDFNSTPINLQQIPSAVQFSKQVSRGYPCLYKAYEKTVDSNGRFQTWTDPSLLKHAAYSWTKQDLIDLIPDRIEVATTPTGRADDLENVNGLDEAVFLSPANVEMTLAELLDRLQENRTANEGVHDPNTKQKPIYYLQSQNSNLTTTVLSPILRHIPSNFPFAEPVLSDPEAINIWIGDHRSITSTHRDPYENLYLVLKGTKTFTLYPPVDEITLPTKLVRTGKYVFDPTTETFSTMLDEPNEPTDAPPRIPWITADPLIPPHEISTRFPLYAAASPRVVKVHEGEILYLPSGWYHHVQQECGIWDEDGSVAPCIAVNYWFDMEYEGEKYVMRQFVGRMAEELRRGEQLWNGQR